MPWRLRTRDGLAVKLKADMNQSIFISVEVQLAVIQLAVIHLAVIFGSSAIGKCNIYIYIYCRFTNCTFQFIFLQGKKMLSLKYMHVCILNTF